MGNSNYKISLAHEVVDSSQKAHSIAQGHSSSARYKYKANALLVGMSSLRPYDPVYFKGLRDGMSGIWVVISVTHVFNLGLKYTMKVHLGSNDQLLQIKPSNLGEDIAKHSGNVQPRIPNEYESLHSLQRADTKNYSINNINTHQFSLDNKPVPGNLSSTLKTYVQTNVAQTSGELHPDPYEIRKPSFPNASKSIVWNDL